MFIIDILKETFSLFIEMAPYLLIGLFFVGLLNLFFNKDLIIKHIGKNNFWSVFKAAMFGVPLPLCSCGVVPSAIYMAKNGASRGSVVSFLISTPQTGIDSMIATYGMMGWVFAVFRPFAALLMGIFGGTVVRFFDKDESGKNLSFEKYKTSDEACSDDSCADDDDCEDEKKPKGKFKQFFQYSFVEFLDDISVQFIVGLFISGLIAFLIPDNFFEGSSFNNGILGMLLMILVGIPMYVCATASIPIALTLMMKGFSPGVAFVFLATGPATNAASLTIIANVLGKKTAILYVAVISLSAIAFGYLLDWIFLTFGTDSIILPHHLHEHGGFINEEIQWLAGAVFFVLLMMSLYRKYIKPKFKNRNIMNAQTFKIEGMNCNHCVINVKKAITQVKGVEEADVSLQNNEAYVKGEFDLSELEKAVGAVGYKLVK